MIRDEQNIYEGKIYVKKLNCTHKELMEMLTSAVVKDGLIIICDRICENQHGTHKNLNSFI